MKPSTPPSLFVFMGLTASGKSKLAKAWAERHHYSYFNSDVVRKQLAGVSESDSKQASWGGGIYTTHMSRRTYDTLMSNAKQELDAGKTVVLDACYRARQEQVRLSQFADAIRTTAYFVVCYCQEEETKRRLKERAEDSEAVSDADWEIYKIQQEKLDPLDDLETAQVISINTENTIKKLLEQLDFAFEKKTMPK